MYTAMKRLEPGAANVVGGVHVIDDKAANLHGVIAIDSLTLGPVIGGCRFWSYATDGQRLPSVLETARETDRLPHLVANDLAEAILQPQPAVAP